MSDFFAPFDDEFVRTCFFECCRNCKRTISFLFTSRLFVAAYGRDWSKSLDQRVHPLRQGDRQEAEVPLQPGHGRLRDAGVPVHRIRRRGSGGIGDPSSDPEMSVGAEHPAPQVVPLVDAARHDADAGVGFGVGVQLPEPAG